MRVVFLGTPAPARVSLKAVLAAGHEVAAVVCQPDRPAGRGRRLAVPPVKAEALAAGLPILQPESVKDPEFQARLRALAPDVLLTVAYGRLLPPAILGLPRLLPLNLHFSLLPRLRGAGPVNWAIIAGLTETGVSVIKMVPALDAGPILARRATPIGPQETAGELGARLADLGAELLVATLADLAAGRASLTPQDDGQASLAPPLTAQDGWLDPTQPARLLHRRGRGVTPWPGASLAFGSVRLKVQGLTFDDEPPQGQPGLVVGLGPAGFRVACGQGHLHLAQVQHPGKRPVSAAEAARGSGPRVGDWLG